MLPSSHFGTEQSPLEQQISGTNELIKQQSTTIAKLSKDGHEVTDAKAHLGRLRQKLTALLGQVPK